MHAGPKGPAFFILERDSGSSLNVGSCMFRSLSGILLSVSLCATSAAAEIPKGMPATPAQRHAPSPQRPGTAARAQTTAADPLTAAAQRKQAAGEPAEVAAATSTYLAQLLLKFSQIVQIEGDADRAARVAEQALQLDSSGPVRIRVATTLLRLNRPAAAVEVLQAGIEGDLANNAQAYMLLGVAQRDSKKEADSVASFGEALKLHPDINVAYALGSVLLQMHREEEAKRLFADIIRASRNEPLWHVAIGDAYREAQYYPEAVAQFKLAIALDPKAPHAEFFLGLTYLQMNQWGPSSDSLQHLRKAVEISPHEYLSNFYLGALESTDGSDLVSSDRHLQAAAEADPKQPEVWLYLGLNANREHNGAAAEKDFRRSIELTGADESRNNYQIRKAYFALGRLLVTSGRREEGLQLLEKYKAAQAAALAANGSAIEAQSGGEAGPAMLAPAQQEVTAAPNLVEQVQPQLTPEQQKTLRDEKAMLLGMLADGFNDLGAAQAHLQEYGKALTSFHAAEEWRPASPTLLRNIGAAAFRLANYAEAARALELYFKALPKDEPDEHAALMLGFSQFNQGRFPAAAEVFGSVHNAAMKDDRAAYSWAFSLVRTGHAQEANGIANALMSRALDPKILSLVCHLYVDAENYQGSLDCYRKAYAEDPQLPLAHYEAGQALVHLDRPQEAVTELEAEKKLEPEDPNVEYALDYALLQCSRKGEAEQRLAKLVAEHPEQAAAQYQLGKLLLDAGKVTEAVQHLEASERADASPDYVHYQLGAAYRKANRTADAEREFKLYRDIKDRKRASATVPGMGSSQ